MTLGENKDEFVFKNIKNTIKSLKMYGDFRIRNLD